VIKLDQHPIYTHTRTFLHECIIYRELSRFVGKNRSKIHGGGEIVAESKNGESKFIPIVVRPAARHSVVQVVGICFYVFFSSDFSSPISHHTISTRTTYL